MRLFMYSLLPFVDKLRRKRKIEKVLKWQSKCLALVNDSIKVLQKNVDNLPRRLVHQFQIRIVVFESDFFGEFRDQFITLRKRKHHEDIEWDEIEELEKISRLTFQAGVELERALLHESAKYECRHKMFRSFTYFSPLS